MAISVYKTWSTGEVLTASDLNASFAQIVNAGQDLIFPLSAAMDINGFEVILDADGDTSITADTDDRIDVRLGGADDFQFAANSFVVLTGSNIDMNAGDLLMDADGNSKFSASTDNQIDVYLNSALDFSFKANSFECATGSGIDMNGGTLTLDADADSTLRETADDVIALRLQGVDSFIFDGDVASPVNVMTFRTAAASSEPQIEVTGADTDIGLDVIVKGAGRLRQGSFNVLNTGTTDTLTKGFTVTPNAAGTKSSGTFTPAYADGNYQTATNGGAHTLAPPTGDGSMVIQYTNNGSAGAVTTSGFTKVSGSFTTTNGDDFLAYITTIGTFSFLNIVALQ